ncbi:MAG TPA: nucleotidyltransferase family protein [Solirubrobacterales bacterium]|nr:nucleotidyltransferase family protein [Solirubrobacterales bacterium]
MTAPQANNAVLARSRARGDISRIASEHGARNIRVFGSASRGEAGARDLDLLVEMAAGRSLLDLIALSQSLEDALRVHVDVLTEAGLSPYLRDRILAEAVPL